MKFGKNPVEPECSNPALSNEQINSFSFSESIRNLRNNIYVPLALMLIDAGAIIYTIDREKEIEKPDKGTATTATETNLAENFPDLRKKEYDVVKDTNDYTLSTFKKSSIEKAWATVSVFESANFYVRSHSHDIAKEMAAHLETMRKEKAIAWTGKEITKWPKRCVVTILDGEGLGVGGASSFVFDRGQVYGWEMAVQGSIERIKDSVIT